MDRVLSPVRSKAEERLQSFFDAALELMQTSSGADFTVQELVEKAGQSLRSFYQYFDGKHAVLLALLEDSVRATAGEIRELVAAEKDPLSALHLFAVEYYRLCTPAPKARKARPRALAEFSLELLVQYPNEAARAFAPLIVLLDQLLDEAVATGQIRDGLAHSRAAGVVLQAIMFHSFSAIISGAPVASPHADPAEELWELLLHGMSSRR
jgi:AcrR family transcriptional regulator